MTHRHISPDIYEDEWFGTLDFFQMALWVGLFARCADDQGRFEDNAYQIRSRLFVYQDVSVEQIKEALATFTHPDRMVRYEGGGKRLIQLVNWWDHQPLQWAVPSKFEPPSGWVDRVRTCIKGQYVVSNWSTREKEQVDSPGATAPSTLNMNVIHEHKLEHESESEPEPCRALQFFVQARGGLCNPMDVDQIKALIDECEEHRLKLAVGVPGADVSGDDWVCAAIKAGNASKQSGVLTIRYLQGILNNWQTRGYGAKPEYGANRARAPAPKTEQEREEIRKRNEGAVRRVSERTEQARLADACRPALEEGE